jgi:hypothetical protein
VTKELKKSGRCPDETVAMGSKGIFSTTFNPDALYRGKFDREGRRTVVL